MYNQNYTNGFVFLQMKMKQQRIYIDTSVFGGYFDIEFAEYTIPLFERVKNVMQPSKFVHQEI